MKNRTDHLGRRNFIKKSAVFTTGLMSISGFQSLGAKDVSPNNGLYFIGPMEGYSPHIGTLVSMLNYNRQTIVNTVSSLSMEELDYLHDPRANTIGALIMHLGATEKYYQINTFEGRQEYNEAEKKVWDAAMNLGDQGRAQIKGHEVNHYLDMINEVRQHTLEELKTKDDEWLMAVDPEWSDQGPLNAYWKWFHVCEHESNHRGQMTWLKGRLPGAKPGRE